MAQDLKDGVNHLNTFESSADTTDPVCLLLCVLRQPRFSMKLAFSQVWWLMPKTRALWEAEAR